MNKGLVCFAMWSGWGGAFKGMNEGKVVCNGVLVNAKKSVLSVS